MAAIQAPKVWDGLELTPWLVAAGTAANTGATGNTAAATQGQPGVNSAWLGLAPNGSWANAYFYEKLGANPTRKSFIYEQSFWFDSPADAAASNCIELDIQQVINGVVFNPAFQFNFSGNALRVWDRTGKQWVATGTPCPRWAPGQWICIKAECHRDDKAVYHDAITVNGQRIELNKSFTAPTLGLNDMLNVAIQLDGNKAATAYKIYIDHVKLTAL